MKTLNTKPQKTTLNIALGLALLGTSSFAVQANSITEALTSGKASANLNLRYESVEEDNTRKDASALTLRTRLGYTTGSINGFSATVELEDSRIVLGQGDYSVGPTSYNISSDTGPIYSILGDPEHTELDQGFVQYKNDVVTAKVGRQVITMDGHRFIGHVGWRQDRQTFDAASFKVTPNKDLTLQYAYITQRNRIFAEAQDFDSKDHLLNLSYETSVGKFVGYSYLLEVDSATDNALDTYGVSFTGNTMAGDTKILYAAEFATQTSENGTIEYDADYLKLEVGAVFSGITAKLGYEVLGSDDGAYGFSTPLATLHKFNGWSDQFLATPAQGLVDTYVSVGAKLGGGGLTVAYHDFAADEATTAIPDAGVAAVDDLGSELNVSYVKAFGKNYVAGIKYATYSAGDIKDDADKLWAWVGVKF